MGELMDNFNNNENNNSDRTTAFTVHKKKRRTDSVSWIISALLLFFLNIFSVGRITIVGQFLDDVIFTYPFGWFKYFLYLLIFIIAFSIYFGIKFKAKKRFLAMVFLTFVVLCWLISSILFIVAYATKSSQFVVEHFWTKSILVDSIKSYTNNWYSNSLWNTAHNFIISDPNSYFTIWAGGGIIGTILCGISSYLTIYGGLIIAIIFMTINSLWIFTGDPFYIFKPKHKRKTSRLRILSLRDKYVLNSNDKSRTKKKRSIKNIFTLINVDDNETFDERQILSSIKESDITIELPSFNKKKKRNIYDQTAENFYKGDFSELNNNYDYSNQNNNYNQGNYYESNRGHNPVNDYNLDEINNLSNNQSFNNNIYEQKVNHYQEIPINNNFVPIVGENQITNNRNSKTNEEARRMFNLESRITPYGGNGQTIEIAAELRKYNKSKDKNEHLDQSGQITLDQFINDAIEEKNNQKQYDKYNNYTSPIQDVFARSIINGQNSFNHTNTNAKQVEIDKRKLAAKKLYVNEMYKLPSIDLMKPDNQNQKEYEILRDYANKKAKLIERVFTQFGVNAKVSNINIGPSVTKYEVQPSAGTKVNSITNLENDLKLALASQSLRIEAPIQGKPAVGLEVPNDKNMVVGLRSVIEKAPIQKVNSKLLFAIGKTVMGELLFGELDKMPHLLVAGSTGSGKSVMINGIICSFLMRAKPHEVKFLMIDPKKVELSIYSSIPHLLAPVISDMTLANNALKKVISEMDRRYALFTSAGTKNIEGYNSKQYKVENKLPYYVIIIDELADLMMTANKKDVEDSIMRLTQMARAAGIHLIVATQRPSTDVLTGVIKSNIPTRIAFSVASSIDSRTILDSMGAEKLIGKGDLLYMAPGSNLLTRAQGAFISDKEIENLVSHCKLQQQQMFDEEFLTLEEDYSTLNNTQSMQKDPMFNEIKDFVVREQKASTSLLQRRFSIGYNRAAKIIDELEMSGIIGPQNGAKPREVFIKNEDMY
ncbi:DNA translocase [Spiroplasma corruscae]|uniref:DNA translocase n=1 Tax=Spiroplasma corruscae TaxID=216934 RepID=A0A222EQ71_9MOLU|nr:DNA translocase FtsK [Spiroplasma corruscae]ASP28606.1 DNA translocase [Spiroplasma corruscae]